MRVSELTPYECAYPARIRKALKIRHIEELEDIDQLLPRMPWKYRKQVIEKLDYYQLHKVANLDLIPMGESVSNTRSFHYRMGGSSNFFIPWTPATHNGQPIRVQRGIFTLLCIFRNRLPKDLCYRIFRTYALADYLGGRNLSIYRDIGNVGDVEMVVSDPVQLYKLGRFKEVSDYYGFKWFNQWDLIRDLAKSGQLHRFAHLIPIDDMFPVTETIPIICETVDWKTLSMRYIEWIFESHYYSYAMKWGMGWVISPSGLWNDAWLDWNPQNHANPNLYTIQFRKQAQLFIRQPYFICILAKVHYYTHYYEVPKVNRWTMEQYAKYWRLALPLHGPVGPIRQIYEEHARFIKMLRE
jgi:hypothetical protein